METQVDVQNSARNSGWIFASALIGACGVGMQIARTICDYRYSNEVHGQWDWHLDILLGAMFLAMAVVNSARLLLWMSRQKAPTQG